jgi:hypothetical protein
MSYADGTKRFRWFAAAALGALTLPPTALAVDYRFCVICDNHRTNALVSSGTIDYGVEWYRVKTAEKYAKAYGARSCSANNFDPATCGDLPEEQLSYEGLSGDQLQGLVSGNPVTTTQTVIEVATQTPARVVRELGKAIGLPW